MKSITFLSFISLFIILSCSETKYKEISLKINEKVNKDALGIDVKYKSVELYPVDTLTVLEEISELNSKLDSIFSMLENEGSIFEPTTLTKAHLLETRNYEENYRRNSISKTKDYYKFVFSDKCFTDWCKELRLNITTIDKYINSDSISKTDKIEFYLTLLWFYKNKFHDDNHISNEIKQKYTLIENALKEQIPLNDRIKELKLLPENEVVYYKFYNKFKIVNPILNNAEQTIEQYFYFDKDMIIFKRDDN